MCKRFCKIVVENNEEGKEVKKKSKWESKPSGTENNKAKKYERTMGKGIRQGESREEMFYNQYGC